MGVATAQQALDAYKAAMSDGKTAAAYRKGIEGFNGNPMALAASDQALQDYQNACVRSVQSGHRARQLLAANPAVWKQNAVTIGASNLGQAGQKAGPKLLAVYQRLQSAWQQMHDLRNSMPGSSSEAGRMRMNAAFDIIVAAGSKGK